MGPSPVVRTAAPWFRIAPQGENPIQAGSPDRVDRRLAAILAADVVGYSQLMEADEAGTVGLEG